MRRRATSSRRPPRAAVGRPRGHGARVPDHHPSDPATENLLDRALSTFERNFIIRALEKSRWNVTATARTLGIPLSTLKFKMDRLEIRELARKIRGG